MELSSALGLRDTCRVGGGAGAGASHSRDPHPCRQLALLPGPAMCARLAGVKRRLAEHASLSPEEEEYVSGILDALYTLVPRRQHAYVSIWSGGTQISPNRGKCEHQSTHRYCINMPLRCACVMSAYTGDRALLWRRLQRHSVAGEHDARPGL